MNFYQLIVIGICGISLALMPKAMVNSAQEYQIVQDLSSQQVNLRAKQVTVRIDGDSLGSGIIIASNNNKYTILTNWHIVKDLGNYVIQTVDGRQHQVQTQTIRQLSNVDLAILQFTSKQNYQIAEMGNSNSLIEGQNIYFAGYPGELRTESDRIYRFFSANIVGLLATPNANGYSLIYDGSAFPGMSGGPVLNDRGQLIGIHGSTNIHAVTGAVSNYAIPSNIYQSAISNINENNSAISSTNQAETVNNNNSVATSTNQSEEVNSNSNDTVAVPETIVETNSNNNVATESTNQSEEVNNNNNDTVAVPETIVETNVTQQPTTEINSSATNSVPVLNSTQNQDKNTEIVTYNSLEQAAENTETKKTTNPPQTSSESVVKTPDKQVNSPGDSSNISPNRTNSNQTNSSNTRKVSLISQETGIDYTNIRNLLAQKEWQEADRQTKRAFSNVFQTIKRKNNTSSIELRTLADRACNDIYTLDYLWRKYSSDRFGFSHQKNIWDNLHQNNDFSLKVWRSFVTEIGWKEGDINSAAGYILYEQLNFNPQTAPQGHLPWWFDYTNEQKNAMRQILTRCNFQNQIIVGNK